MYGLDPKTDLVLLIFDDTKPKQHEQSLVAVPLERPSLFADVNGRDIDFMLALNPEILPIVKSIS